MKKLLQVSIFILFFSLGLFSLQAFAQTYYWVGGSGNWNDPNHWSLSSGGVPIGPAGTLPNQNIDVVFDQNSIDPTLNDYTISVNPSAVCRNMTWLDVDEAINPTLAGGPAATIDIFGSLNISAVITNNFEGTFRFLAPNAQTVRSNTPFHPSSTVLFNNATGKWTLGGSLNVSNLNLQNGELDVSASNYSIIVRGNWTASAAARFISQGGTVIFSGTSAAVPQSINTSPSYVNREFFNVIIDNTGAGIRLDSPVMVGENNDGRITFSNGVVTTSLTNMLNLNLRTEVTGANDDSHVNGYVRKFGSDTDDEFLFPIGNGSFYRPAGLKFQNSNPDAQFVAKYTRRSPADVNYPATNVESPLTVSKFEYWEIERTGGNASTRVILTWEIPISGPENYLGDPASAENLLVASWNSDNPLTGQWVKRNSTDQMVTNSNPGTYSGHVRMQSAMANVDRRVWTIGSEIIPLPIELLYFTARMVNKTIQLEWATLSEKDNDYFTVEKSADGKNFTSVNEIDAAGNSQQLLTYTSSDASPFSPVTYYRLKQTDTDGKFTYSKIQAVYAGEKVTLITSHSSDHGIQVSYYLPQSEEGVLLLHDTRGVLVWSKSIAGSNALQTQSVKLPYPAGVYILTLQQAGESITKKLFIR